MGRKPGRQAGRLGAGRAARQLDSRFVSTMRLLCRSIPGFVRDSGDGCPAVCGESVRLWLIGSRSDSEIRICSVADATLPPVAAWLPRVEEALPVGLQVLGLFCASGGPNLPGDLPKDCSTRLQLVASTADDGALAVWELQGGSPESLGPWAMDTEPLGVCVRGRLEVAVPAKQTSRQLQRVLDDLPRSLRFQFPGCNTAPNLEELGQGKGTPLASSGGGVVSVEVLAEDLGATGPTNFADRAAPEIADFGFDFAALLPAGADAVQAARALLQGAQRQITAALNAQHGEAWRCFLPAGLEHVVCHRGTEDRAVRQELHRLWRLPEVPLLLPDCALPWAGLGHARGVGKPINLHLECGRQPGWWKGGQESRLGLIRGLCEYSHYMQDKFDDANWGCAYRSLQTCVSWFRLNCYSPKPVPSIPDIQEHLKRIDEAHSDLKVGSRRWIGSVEVMYLLQDYLQVDCKMMHCQDAADLNSQASQLLSHLETEGTPIMMGAGDYAYTLVGVRLDPTSGEVAYLLMDPHYTGADDVKTILQKGWVGWKALSFLEKESGGKFINCCLPMAPKGPECI